MIHDVDASLREMLKRDVINGSGVEVAFDAPTSEWAARRNSPTIDVYLYDIREELRYRSMGSISEVNKQGFVEGHKEPPRWYRLSYLVTAWTQRPEDEHRLLSAVLGLFLKGDVLPMDALQGQLAEQAMPVMVTVAHPPPQDRSISDVWSALGGELKPSLDLCITAPFDLGRLTAAGPPVLESPKLRFTDDDGIDETAKGKKGKKGKEPEPEPEIVIIDEVFVGGTGDEGRRFTMKSMPRPPRP